MLYNSIMEPPVEGQTPQIDLNDQFKHALDAMEHQQQKYIHHWSCRDRQVHTA